MRLLVASNRARSVMLAALIAFVTAACLYGVTVRADRSRAGNELSEQRRPDHVRGDIVAKSDQASESSAAMGDAHFVIYPSSEEIELRLRRFPPAKGQLFMVWLSDAPSSARAYLAGAFPKSLAKTGGSIEVVGNKRVSRRNIDEADFMRVTRIDRRAAIRIGRSAQKSGYERRKTVSGRPVTTGTVIPCPEGVCP